KNLIKLFNIQSLLVAVCSMFSLVSGTCNICQENLVKCINETAYEFCAPNVQPGQISSCGDGEVCTSMGAICMPRLSTVQISCTASEANGSCQSCDGSSLFICTSRTTFQMCDNGNLTGPVKYCKDNTVCAIQSGKFCVDSCEVTTALECNREAA
ncbi:hypothetical protein KR009_007363, partial [Drosophila setifemur]